MNIVTVKLTREIIETCEEKQQKLLQDILKSSSNKEVHDEEDN